MKERCKEKKFLSRPLGSGGSKTSLIIEGGRVTTEEKKK